MISILVGNDIEQAIKTFTNRTRKSGLLTELRLREFYESPSERKRRKRTENIKRAKRREEAIVKLKAYHAAEKRRKTQLFQKERRAESLTSAGEVCREVS